MRIEARVSSVEILPSDASGVRLVAEVCDASGFVESILRRPDDGADSWALGMRYQEVCDENRRLRAARQSAPETPTPRIEVLEADLAQFRELAREAADLYSSLPSINGTDVFPIAQRLAALHKEE